MKAKEFISEAIENKPDLDPLPATYVLPKLQNQDAYLQYRFGIALASARARVAGEIPFEPQSDFGENMAGILLYTGSADKEGSLGGLVELGNISQITRIMRDAFQEALVCTNDPECMSNLPARKNSNGAACHSCCMISETACENGNRMLDRGLVVPIPERENNAYFRELVNDLCQVEL